MHNLLGNAFTEVFKYMARKVESKHMDKVERYLTVLGASVRDIHALALNPEIIVALYEVDEGAVNRSLNFLARSIKKSNGETMLLNYAKGTRENNGRELIKDSSKKWFFQRIRHHDTSPDLEEAKRKNRKNRVETSGGFMYDWFGWTHGEQDTHERTTDTVSGNGSNRL